MSQPTHIPLYIISPPSPLFASHWSLFIPSTLHWSSTAKRFDESDTGRRIHVSGDRLNGFTLEIVRDYRLSAHRGVARDRVFKVGWVPVTFVTERTVHEAVERERRQKEKDEDEGGGYVHNFPRDQLEDVCCEIQAPGPSLTSASSARTGNRKGEVRDCQWWVRVVCSALMERGMLVGLEGEEPEEMLKVVPRN